MAGKFKTGFLMNGKVQNRLPQKTKSIYDLVYRVGALILRFIFHINGGLDVRGRENIPAEGGVIIASNHISYLDPPLLGAALPRRASYMARKGLFQITLLGWFIKHYAFPVDREKTLPSAIKEAVKRLKNGELLVIFPEGRRSETGKLLEGKRGVGMIAGISKVPIVPALIIGSNKALPYGARWIKRARISIIFGTPVDTSTVRAEGGSLYENITRRIMYSIGELKNRYADNCG